MSTNNSEILDRLANLRIPRAKRIPKPIAKMSEKKKGQIQEEKGMVLLDKMFYAEVWSASPHKCQCGCKSNLGNIPRNIFFHHLLEKERYPELRHKHENIMLLAEKCHTAYHNNPDNRPEVKKRRTIAQKELL